MRWVKDTLPPRLRARWLLTTTRLSMSSLAGTARTLVAVGTVRLCSMLVTTRTAAPRSGVVCASFALGGADDAPGFAGGRVGAGWGVTAVAGASAGCSGAVGAGGSGALLGAGA